MKAAVAEREPGVVWVPKKGASRDVSKPRPTFGLGDVSLLRMLCEDEQTTCILWVLVTSGLRIGEVLALDWEDVDLENGTVRVHKHLLRNGTLARGRKKHPDADVLQPLHQDAVTALRNLLSTRDAKTGPVWLNSLGERLSYHAWYDRWGSLRKAYGLEHMHTHDIRSVHLTAFAEHATMKEVLERGGHSDYRSAMRYQRPDAQRQKEIVAQMSF